MLRKVMGVAAIMALGIAGHARAADLLVQVEGIVEGKGHLVVTLYKDNGPSTFLTAPTQVQDVKTNPGTAEVLFKGLVPGRYVAIAFQDLTGNGTLESDSRGLPAAPHGRSGESKEDTTILGPPSMDVNGFTVIEPKKTILIHLK